MNIAPLKLFVRLAATHNISRAGQELGLSAAVASAYLKKLESSLGVRLLHRTTRQVSLTEEGMVFLPHAQEVLAQVETACASIGVGHSSPQGTLRVSAPASFGRMHLLPALAQFMQAYPDLHVDFHFSDNIIDLVEGGFDVAIRNAPLQDSSLIARKLVADKRILCASPEYIKKYGEPQTPMQLLDHQCIHFAQMDNWQFKTEEGVINIKSKGRFRVDNGEALRDACCYGLGITINSLWSAYRHIQRGELVQVLKDYPLVEASAIWALYPSSRLLAPKVRAFIDFYSQLFTDNTYWQ